MGDVSNKSRPASLGGGNDGVIGDDLILLEQRGHQRVRLRTAEEEAGNGTPNLKRALCQPGNIGRIDVLA